jgi:arachidonate 15-lipoxygenase
VVDVDRRKFIKSTSVVAGSSAVASTFCMVGSVEAAPNPWADFPKLPQHEHFFPAMFRRFRVTIEASLYIWDYNPSNASGVPTVRHFPDKQRPDIVYLGKLLDILGTQTANFIEGIPKIFSSQFEQRYGNDVRNKLHLLKQALDLIPNKQSRIIYQPSFLSSVTNLVIAALSEFLKFVSQLGSEISGYEHGLQHEFDSLFTSVPLPSLADDFESDETFARLRVEGLNPLLIKQISVLPNKFPLTEERYSSVMGANDSLMLAAAEKRLYLLDYQELVGMIPQNPNNKPATGTSYAYSPIALFALPLSGERTLTPVAIQCDQDPSENPIFTPSHQANTPEYWAWQMAKTVVSSADDLHHEFFTHLGHTHLIVEAIAISTHRQLAPSHPLYHLLKPHLHGTMFINNLAFQTLLEEDLFIDLLFQPNIPDIVEEMIHHRVEGYDFYEKMLPTDLNNRGVSSSQDLPHYPYRDDGILIWDAIHQWCQEYVHTYYSSNREITRDYELQAWTRDVRLNGKVTGFRTITSREQLVDVLTMIIFTASAQHAAVNFNQPDLAVYAPARSNILKAPAPKSHHLYTASKDSWESMLPPLLSGLTRIFILNVMGLLYHGKLGEYISPDGSGSSEFIDQTILQDSGPLKRFQRKLQEIEIEIDRRNQYRSRPYQYLKPSNIPPSTNI